MNHEEVLGLYIQHNTGTAHTQHSHIYSIYIKLQTLKYVGADIYNEFSGRVFVSQVTYVRNAMQ